MAKIPVVVLYGGRSNEHEVSCRSATFILKSLNRDRYDIRPVAVGKDGQWRPQQLNDILRDDTVTLPILSQATVDPMGFLRASNPVVFPIIHGSHGEDGTLQGLLEMAEVAYVGSDHCGSSIGMDKIVSKKLVATEGVAIVPYVEIRAQSWAVHQQGFLDRCEKDLRYPMFVKPARLGSSVGISKVKSGREALATAIEDALRYDDKILIENGLDVFEIECAILGDHFEPLPSVVGEIAVESADFYDYAAKYQSATAAAIHIPARLSDTEAKLVQQSAVRIFRALELDGLARIDFFLEKTSRQLFFNEVNTLPGFTSISQYPMLLKASGYEGPKLMDRLIELAQRRHQGKAKLQKVK